MQRTLLLGDISLVYVLRGDGTLVTWWDRDAAHDPPVAPHAVPQLVTADAIGVSAAGVDLFVRRPDHSVWYWQYEFHGREHGSTAHWEPRAPIPVHGFENVIHVDSKGQVACAVRADQSVWCLGMESVPPDRGGWGWVLGTPVQVPGLARAIRVAVGGYGACAVRDDGSVWCWDVEHWSQGGPSSVSIVPTQVPGIDRATQVTAGTAFACALRDDGSVRCWGENTNGQLGNGTRRAGACNAARCFAETATPVATLDRVVRVSAGDDTACALRSDGTAWCWGDNGNGQVGDGSRTNRDVPTLVHGLSRVTDLVTSGQYACAIDQDDTMWAWGWPGGDTSPLSTVPIAFGAQGPRQRVAAAPSNR